MKKIIILSVFFITISYLLLRNNIEISDLPDTLYAQDRLIKSNNILNNYVEGSVFVWKDNLYYLASERTIDGKDHTLAVYNFKTNRRLVHTGLGLGLASVFVEDNKIYIFATKNWGVRGSTEIVLITTSDLEKFSLPASVIKSDINQSFFNTSITKNNNNEFIMAVETDQSDLPAFNIVFYRSTDLVNWERFNDKVFGSSVYVACPSIRFIEGFYYMLYLRDRIVDLDCGKCVSYVTQVARSKNLADWDYSHKDVIYPENEEGINTSDPDITSFEGITYIIYSVGDQATWSKMKYATYSGNMEKFFSMYFE